MKRLIVNIARLAAQVIALILLFIPGMYQWCNGVYSYPGYTMRPSIALSLFEVPFYDNSPTPVILLILVLLCMLACLALWVLNLLYALKKKASCCLHKAFFAAPIAQIVVFVIYTIVTCQEWDPYNSHRVYSYGTVYVLFFFECAILVAILVLEIFKFFVHTSTPATVILATDEVESAEDVTAPDETVETTEPMTEPITSETVAEPITSETVAEPIASETAAEPVEPEISVATDVPAPAVASVSPVSATSVSVIEQLEKYKELFDKGVLTEQEFTEKKKQLLGL